MLIRNQDVSPDLLGLIGAAEHAVRKITPLFPLSHIRSGGILSSPERRAYRSCRRAPRACRSLHFSEPIGPAGAHCEGSILMIFVYRGLNRSSRP
jgi:hypothetical protein